MRTVKLTYFKPTTGKYYSGCETPTTWTQDFDVYREVRELADQHRLPGLVIGHGDYIVLVEPENGVPQLILPDPFKSLGG